MIEKAFEELFPGREFPYHPILKYSRAFKGYNANIRLAGNNLQVKLSYEWKDVSVEIKRGLIQLLLLKLFKGEHEDTLSLELYKKFIKTLPRYSTVTESDPLLEASFNRVNGEYFNDFLEKPNLVWGGESFRKLGTYEYARDTITISGVLQKDESLLDYVMYHELLHKKIQFYDKNGRSYHHTRTFKDMERKWKDPLAEKKLTEFLRRQKRKSFFRFW